MSKRKFSWFDAAVIIILAAAIIGIAYKFNKANIAAPIVAKQKLFVTYYIEYTADTTARAIKIGDQVRDTVQNDDFGKVVDIKIGPSVFFECGEDGQFVSSSRQGFSSLYLTMEASGIIGDNGVTIDKTVYYVGQSLSLYVGNCYLASNGKIAAFSETRQ